MDEKQQQQLQDAADSAYMKVIWWESTKIMLQDTCSKHDNVQSAEIAKAVPVKIVEDFKARCESGFFDVKRQAGKGE